MKPNRFLLLFFLLFAANAAVYFPSCQRDTDQPQVKPLSDVPVDSRECGISTYCDCTVTTDANTVLDLCGDMPQVSTLCTACGNSNKTGITGAEFLDDEPRTFCVNKDGELCITNAGLSSVGVTVQFGSSTPVNVTLSPSQTQCFNTDDDCTVTSSGCN